MELNKVQSAMLNYFASNNLLGLFLPFSSVFIFLYGGYSILIRISFISPIISFVSSISAFLHIMFILGCILAFAKNEMKTLVIGFGLIAVGEALGMITMLTNGYRFNLLNNIIYIIFYICLAYFCMVRFNKSGGETS